MDEKLNQLLDQFNEGVPKDEVVLKSPANSWPERIKNIRATLGKTQQQFAKQWESGKSKPSKRYTTLLKTMEKPQNHP